MHRYTAYGLSIASRLALPELHADDGSNGRPADLTFDRGTAAGAPDDPGTGSDPRRSELVCAWGHHIVLRMRAGRTCTYTTSDVVGEDQLRRYLLGPALGTLLHQRGLLTLHASAVEVDGRALIFVGQKGAGKSTTVATLLMRGHTLLADDIVAIDTAASSGPVVLPAFSRVRLLPDSAAAVRAPADELEARAPSQTKRAWRVHNRFAGGPVPLGQVFVLEPDTAIGAHVLTGARAVAPLIEHLYAPRFVGTEAVTLADLAACATLARTTPITRITRGESLQTLPQFVDLVEHTAHATQTASPARVNVPA